MNTAGVPTLRLDWPTIAAIAFNLVPIVGVVFWGWSAFALIFLYWIENLVIGARTVASMLATAALEAAKIRAAIAFAAFFTVHYGMFCFVHGTFVTAMFGGSSYAGDDMFDLWSTMQALFAAEPSLTTGLISIVLWQIVQFTLFILRGEARTAHPLSLMGAPYPRIIILHLTIIFGGFLLMLLNQPVAGLVLLALLKAAFDIAEAQGRGVKFGFTRPSQAPEA